MISLGKKKTGTHRQLLTGNNLNIHQRAVNSKAQVAELIYRAQNGARRGKRVALNTFKSGPFTSFPQVFSL